MADNSQCSFYTDTYLEIHKLWRNAGTSEIHDELQEAFGSVWPFKTKWMNSKKEYIKYLKIWKAFLIYLYTHRMYKPFYIISETPDWYVCPLGAYYWNLLKPFSFVSVYASTLIHYSTPWTANQGTIVFIYISHSHK